MSGQRVARYAAFFLLIDGTFLGLFLQAWTDVPMVFFGLFATYVYLSTLKDHPYLKVILAGSLLGLSILSKETGVLFFIAIVGYSLIVSHDLSVRRLVILLGTTALVAAAGLQLYDMIFTPFPTFIAHIQYILGYNSLIGLSGWPQESWLPFLGRSVVPFAWLVFYPPFGFISTMPEEWLLLASLPVISTSSVGRWRPSANSRRGRSCSSPYGWARPSPLTSSPSSSGRPIPSIWYRCSRPP